MQRGRSQSASPLKSPDIQKVIYLSIAITVNLLGVACLFIAWNAKGINNDNFLWAVLLVSIVTGCGVIVCCLAAFFIRRPWPKRDACKKRIFDVQTVYPTPEFQYFTNTMLNRVQTKASSRGSDFSVVSTAPAGSPQPQRKADDSSMLEFPLSPNDFTTNDRRENGRRSSANLTTTTCTGDNLELSLESAFSPPPHHRRINNIDQQDRFV